MNKYYSLLGIGLLSAASLISCQKDVLAERIGKEGVQAELRTYTAEAGIQGYMIEGLDASSRANVQENGKSFMWNAGDKVTIWDGTNGYMFVTTDETLDQEPSRKTSFTGEASLTDQAQVWGIYPASDAENPLAFTLAENAVQPADGLPALKQTMCMLAEGVVEGTQVQNLNFKHLTALFQFNVTTTREEKLTLKSVRVEADSQVFPTHLEVATSGEELSYAYSDKKTELTLAMSDRELSKGETLTGYMNFLPTEGLTGETVLTFRVTFEVLGETGPTEETVIVKQAKVSALYSKSGAMVPTEGYVAGKRYVVNLQVGVPGSENGYIQEGNTYKVLASEGLWNIPAEVWADANNTIELDDNFDMAEMGEWAPVATLRAIFDGKGKTLSNLTVSSSAAEGAGLFITNEGTIRNLTLDNVNVQNYTQGNMGLLAVNNKTTISNCVIRNATVTVGGSGVAGLISGVNEGLIQDCTVEGESVLTATGSGSYGGVAGKSVGGTIKGCAVRGIIVKSSAGNVSAFLGEAGANTTLEGCSVSGIIRHNGENTWIGGMVAMAWTENLIIKLSYATVEIETTDSGGSSIGGIIGQGGGQGTKTLSGVYSTSSARGTSGGRFSQLVRKAVTVTCNTCYFTSGQACEAGALAGATLADVSAIRGAVSQINTAAADAEYEFIVNEGNDREPLILQKKQ